MVVASAQAAGSGTLVPEQAALFLEKIEGAQQAKQEFSQQKPPALLHVLKLPREAVGNSHRRAASMSIRF